MSATPKQRNTRSSSNSTNITLQDIKVLIEKSNNDLLKNLTSTLEREVDKLSQTITSLLSRVQKLEESNRSLASKCEFLEEKYDQVCVGDMFTDEMCRESEERMRRRKFLILSGISEHNSGNIDERNAKDSAVVTEMARELGVDNFVPRQVERIGRINGNGPRLLRIKCPNMNVKVTLLRQSKKLRHSARFRKVYINPDLTKRQREKSAKLRSELRRRRDAGEKVFIRGDRVVVDDASFVQNFQ